MCVLFLDPCHRHCAHDVSADIGIIISEALLEPRYHSVIGIWNKEALDRAVIVSGFVLRTR